MNIAFWSIKNRPIIDLVSRLAHENEADFLILTETNLDNAEVVLSIADYQQIVRSKLNLGSCRPIRGSGLGEM